MMICVLWVAALAIGALSSVPGKAEELRPFQGGTVQLGPVNGTVYYTESDGGYRVLATFSEGPESTPLRLTATLLPGQSVSVSVPGRAGTPPAEVQFRRVGDHLFLNPGPPPLRPVIN